MPASVCTPGRIEVCSHDDRISVCNASQFDIRAKWIEVRQHGTAVSDGRRPNVRLLKFEVGPYALSPAFHKRSGTFQILSGRLGPYQQVVDAPSPHLGNETV